MGLLRIAALSLFAVLAGAAPAAAAPAMLGAGEDPGVAVDRAETAHVAWLAEPSAGRPLLEYCQVPRGRRACSVRRTFDLPRSGVGDVQVLAPRPGAVFLVTSVLNDRGVIFGSADGGATFAPARMGELIRVDQAVFGPGETINLMSGTGDFVRFGTDGSGPAGWAVSFDERTAALFNTLAPYGSGYAAFLSGAARTRSLLYSGIGDPNLPQSWSEGPLLGQDRLAPSAMGGRSGTWVAYLDRRGRSSAVRVRRLRDGRLGRPVRLRRLDTLAIHAAQGPRGDMIVVWQDGSSEVEYSRSRDGRRWTRARRLFRGHDPEGLRPALGRRGGWMAWESSGVVRIAALPRAPRR